ncbi:MAG: hypothetical protein GXP63_04500 [DPANN group archaeon]|nr:hypothetical protein [DPANN group archaeon]
MKRTIHRKRRKKASLNIAINAIVILVMAITMLGLGLGFIRDKFGSAGDLLDDVQQKVKEGIIEDFSSGPSIISFPKSTFKISAGDSLVIAAGIKNQEETAKNFGVELIALNQDTVDAAGVSNAGDPIDSDADQALSFQYIYGYDDIAPNDYRIVPIKIMTKTGTAVLNKGQTFFVRFRVCDEGAATTGVPAEQCSKSGSYTTYAQKEFFIEII